MVKIMWWYPTEGYQMLVFAKIGKNFDMWCFLARFFVVVGMQRGEKGNGKQVPARSAGKPSFKK